QRESERAGLVLAPGGPPGGSVGQGCPWKRSPRMSRSLPSRGALVAFRSFVAKATNIPALACPDSIASNCPGGAQWTFGLNGGGRKQVQPAFASCAGLTAAPGALATSTPAAAPARTTRVIRRRIVPTTYRGIQLLL